MKNGLLVLNVVLLVAVAVLFYLHFSSKKTTDKARSATPTASASSTNAGAGGEQRIAYFEMDSITSSFAMVKDVKAELSREEDRINNTLTGLQRSYNDRMVQLQNSQGAASQVASQDLQREVMQLQEKFSSQKETMNQNYQKLYMRKMQDVKSRIEDYLKEYNKDKGYTYILAYEPGFMFFRDSNYNITADLVKGLNDQYKKK